MDDGRLPAALFAQDGERIDRHEEVRFTCPNCGHRIALASSALSPSTYVRCVECNVRMVARRDYHA